MTLNKNNLDIFVCSHKQFKKHFTNVLYKTLSLGNNTELYGDDIYRDDSGDNISDMNGFYSELTGIYWIWKNYNIKDYVGICHYRRYFDFWYNSPDDSEDWDVILPSIEVFPETVYQHYAKHHNQKDLKCICDIMIEKYGVSVEIINDVFNNQNGMYAYNMFIFNKTIFNEYCEFIFGILNDYLKYHNISNMDDVYNMVESNKNDYLKDNYPNNTIKYQSRIGAFLAERLMNVFVKWKGLKVKTYDVVISENKYENIKTTDFL